jgi:hypothetical protein
MTLALVPLTTWWEYVNAVVSAVILVVAFCIAIIVVTVARWW